jgi:hypothetical protein
MYVHTYEVHRYVHPVVDFELKSFWRFFKAEIQHGSWDQYTLSVRWKLYHMMYIGSTFVLSYSCHCHSGGFGTTVHRPQSSHDETIAIACAMYIPTKHSGGNFELLFHVFYARRGAGRFSYCKTSSFMRGKNRRNSELAFSLKNSSQST